MSIEETNKFENYRELLKQNQILNRTAPNSKEHKKIGRELLEYELVMTSQQIIENAEIAFPDVTKI